MGLTSLESSCQVTSHRGGAYLSPTKDGLAENESVGVVRVPMDEAASRPVGGPKAPKVRKWLETLAVVVAPALVPALVLAVSRSGTNHPLPTFTLVDVAFGVVAIAFAALTRAMAGTEDKWYIVGAVCVFAMIFETALAIARDSVLETDELVRSAETCREACDSTRLSAAVNRVLELSPTYIDWALVGFVGVFLSSVVLRAIWSES